MGLEAYVSADLVRLNSLDTVTDERSEHDGKRKGLLPRASETGRFIATNRPTRRRLITPTIPLMYNFVSNTSIAQCAGRLVHLHGLERRVIDTLLRRLHVMGGLGWEAGGHLAVTFHRRLCLFDRACRYFMSMQSSATSKRKWDWNLTRIVCPIR